MVEKQITIFGFISPSMKLIRKVRRGINLRLIAIYIAIALTLIAPVVITIIQRGQH